MSLRGVQLACFPVSLHIGGHLARLSVSLCTGLRSHASRSIKVKQLSELAHDYTATGVLGPIYQIGR